MDCDGVVGCEADSFDIGPALDRILEHGERSNHVYRLFWVFGIHLIFRERHGLFRLEIIKGVFIFLIFFDTFIYLIEFLLEIFDGRYLLPQDHARNADQKDEAQGVADEFDASGLRLF